MTTSTCACGTKLILPEFRTTGRCATCRDKAHTSAPVAAAPVLLDPASSWDKATYLRCAAVGCDANANDPDGYDGFCSSCADKMFGYDEDGDDAETSENFDGPCEDAPCCGCCGTDPYGVGEGDWNQFDDFDEFGYAGDWE